MTDAGDAGRICPLRYRYGAAAIAQAETKSTQTLYVIGGLYGNLSALKAVLEMREQKNDARLCFNGDFNWFNIDDGSFVEINHTVLSHDAIVGNVEAEFGSVDDDAGCGCAYPDNVDAATVTRSNLIHARLKKTAARHPELLARIDALPMFRCYAVGNLRVGVVHGDADSLAGWRFDASALNDASDEPWRTAVFASAEVDVFASSHTCLPALRIFADGSKAIINNGAAGMPNFASSNFGVLTRISTRPSPFQSLYGCVLHGVHLDALAIDYDQAQWTSEFLNNWPPESAAHISYFARITSGPNHTMPVGAGDTLSR